MEPEGTSSSAQGLPPLPARPRDGHKGTFGHVLVLAGSLRYGGAAVLTARAVLRGGAGLVTLGCPEPIQPMIASRLLCEISHPLPAVAPGVFSHHAVTVAMDLAERASVVAIGPGISTEPAAMAFARDMARLCPQPMVMDADGLNAFTGRATDLLHRAGPRLLTPHAGEAGRLLGIPTADVIADRENAARTLARQTNAVVVLKGAPTLICDGDRYHVNRTGNSGLATAGSGDVLTGLLAALVAQGMESFDAAVLGAHLHGVAGDLAAVDKGEHSLMASDLLDYLPRAFVAHGAAN